MARILVISPSDLGSDPRVDRQIEALQGRHEVVAAGFGAPGVAGVQFVPIRPPESSLARRAWTQVLRTLRRFRAAYWSEPAHRAWRDALSGVDVDLVVANDALALPLAFEVAGGAPVIFDAHEYAPSEHATSALWRLLIQPFMTWICREYIPRVSAMTTVSSGIADRYEADTSVRATLILNASRFVDLEPSAVDPERIRMVHWGLADPQRRLELMIEAMAELDARYSLDLVLVRGEKYVERLRRLAGDDERIAFLPPIAMQDLPRFGNAYDIGVFVLPPGHMNQEFVLPNKFFEFVQARLAVAIGPSPEMARIAREHGFGLIADDFSAASLAAAIRATEPGELGKLKDSAHRAARELSAEHEQERILELVDGVLLMA